MPRQTEEKGTLIIHNIDKVLLEEQRLALSRTLFSQKVDPDDDELLTGLLNMLDAWSDEVYFKKQTEVAKLFIITHTSSDVPLYWDNQNGWVDIIEEATAFTTQETATFNLPMDGEWIPKP